MLFGAPDSPFHGGTYAFQLELGSQYPLVPPVLRCLTPNGRFKVGEALCIDGLTHYHKDGWLPTMTFAQYAAALTSVMCEFAIEGVGFHRKVKAADIRALVQASETHVRKNVRGKEMIWVGDKEPWAKALGTAQPIAEQTESAREEVHVAKKKKLTTMAQIARLRTESMPEESLPTKTA